ncbi:MAG: hypothetical protein H7Z74_07880 [Anaerolineae bacterium]|nr:hypothetical protein [Gemmatimonadaceae bacterium]
MTEKEAKKDEAEPAKDEVVLLKDLAPRKNVTGGGAKLLFGEDRAPKPEPEK